MPVEVRYAAARLETAKGEPAGVLLPEEGARAAAYADGGPRGRFVAGRLLVRRLAAGLLDMDPGAGARDPLRLPAVRSRKPWSALTGAGGGPAGCVVGLQPCR